MKKHLEIKTIEHKGVKVILKVDYDEATVSLVQYITNRGYEVKNWVFANRGLEYLNPWLNILEAMSVAVKEGKKELEAKLAEDSKFRDEVVIGVMNYKVVKPKKK